MKRFVAFITVVALVSVVTFAQPKSETFKYPLSYYLPDHAGYTYDSKVPTPESVLGYMVGEQHAEWTQVVDYMKALAAASPRVSIRETGRTYQHRPFIEVAITSPANQANLEQLRSNHLRISDASQSLDIDKMPVVVSIIGSIHGNEASGVNSTIITAYLMAAAQGAEIDKILDNTIILIYPGANPDGINRFATWVNTTRSFTDVSDTNSREFAEPWPSSRTNHYWADCNRDWIMVQHPEGINGVETYFHWLPNVVADLHEQGSGRHFYFSPGHPKRTNPLTPQENQDLTTDISNYVAHELDIIGTSYYSKEGYDDYYYGKGAAYGDVHGSVCLLYEQATTRGHLRNTVFGTRPFAWTVRNQARASYATILAAYNMRSTLLEYQQRWYRESAKKAAQSTMQAYVFNSRGNRAVEYHFLENMAHHHIDVYHLASKYKHYKPEDSYIIPAQQPNFEAIKALLDDYTEFTDSTFYDISAWTVSRAFNLDITQANTTSRLIGEKVGKPEFPKGSVIGGTSEQAYVFEPTEFYSHKILNELLLRNLRVTVASKPFTFKSGNIEKKMPYGTMVVMTKNQPLSPTEIHNLLHTLAEECGVDIYSASTSLMKDVDLGSPGFIALTEAPKVAVLTGSGASVPESGEVWHLLDQRLQMRPTMIKAESCTPSMLGNYNTLIVAGGVPDLSEAVKAEIKSWVARGGTLILSGKAHTLASNGKIVDIKLKNSAAKRDSSAYLSFASKKEANTGRTISGVILNCKIDKTHPLCWGLDQDEIPVIKSGNIFFRKDKDPYASPMHYAQKPRISGFLAKQNETLLRNTPAAFVKSHQRGHVIVFADDMNFRSYFFGTSKIFLNAIFYNKCM